MAYVSPATDDTSTDLDTDEKNQMGLPSGRSSAPSAALLHQCQPQSDIHSHEYHQLSPFSYVSQPDFYFPPPCLSGGHADGQTRVPGYGDRMRYI